MNRKQSLNFIESEFNNNVLPTLMDYIRIDNLSPYFDPQWDTNGKADKAVDLLVNWAKNQEVEGLKAEVIKIKDLTPLIFIEIEHNGGKGDVFMYGHYDKQPHFEGWIEGTGPTTPKIIGDLLYGRGGADDGYALFSSLLSIKNLQKSGVKHGNIIILIEGSEESGSCHLMSYIEKLKDRIKTPKLIVCLDSGVKDYKRLWITTSLRGNIVKDITVKCLKEAVHSGLGSGQGPDSFNVIRQLLDRIDDSKTGIVSDSSFNVNIPKNKIIEAEKVSSILGKSLALAKPLDNVSFTSNNLTDLYLRGTWKPALTVIGQSGLPVHLTAGNVLRAETSIRISLRIPPTLDAIYASNKLDQILNNDIPYNSKLEIKSRKPGYGWSAKIFSKNLENSFEESSIEYWGNSYQTVGEGGSIPFINTLSNFYPDSDIIVMGVLGPGSNAHAANETLNIPYCIKVTSCLSHAIYDMFK